MRSKRTKAPKYSAAEHVLKSVGGKSRSSDLVHKINEANSGSCEHLGTQVMLSVEDGDSDMEFCHSSAGLKPMHMDIEKGSALKTPVIGSVMVSRKVTPMARAERLTPNK